MNKLIIFIFCQLCLTIISSQNQWKSTLTEPYYEVDDIAILGNNRYYLSLSKTHEIFESRDSGASWRVLGQFETKYSYTSSKSLEVVDDKLLVIHYPRNGTTSLYNLEEEGNLIKEKTGKTLFKQTTKIDKEGNLFQVLTDYVYSINSNFEVDRNSPILTDSYIIRSFLYTSENNYVVLRNFSSKDTFRIVKFNSKTGEYKLHSMFFDGIVPENIVVSENGSVVYYSRSNKLLYAAFDKPFSYKAVPVVAGRSSLITIQLTESGEVFIVTDSDIYMTNEIQMDKWAKCYQMSQDLPLQEEDDVSNYYCFKDSMSAIISYGTICGASRVYCFSPKFKQWKDVKLDINLENIIDLKADKEGRLYGFRPCDSWLKTRYLVSEDQGKTWKYLKVYGFDVHGLAINYEGNAVAIILNKEVFIRNASTNAWDNILTSNVIKPNVEVYHCYSLGKYLILDGLVGGAFPQTQNCFYSEDAGRSWQTTTTPVTLIDKFFPSMETLVDQDGNWLIYNSPANYGWPIGLMISYDKGLTWKKDTRFSQFKEINEVIKLDDGRFLVSGSTNEYNIFIVDDTGNPKILSPDLYKKDCSLKSYPGGSIIGFESLSGLDQPVILFIRKDSSYKYQFSYSGLGHSPYDSWLIKSAVVGKNNQIFLSLAMDGIYTNTTDIFSNINNPKLKSGLTLMNNLSTDVLVLKENEGKSVMYSEYSIINSLGGIVSKGKISSDGVISISNLSTGVYYLIILDNHQNSVGFKFVKI